MKDSFTTKIQILEKIPPNWIFFWKISIFEPKGILWLLKKLHYSNMKFDFLSKWPPLK